MAFAVATGRSLARVREVLREPAVPAPDIVIASVGTEIFYGLDGLLDRKWTAHIDVGWQRQKLLDLTETIPGLRLQEDDKQGTFKISYYVDLKEFQPSALETALSAAGAAVTVVRSRGAADYLDLLPKRASKGLALRYVSAILGVRLDAALVCGDSGNDRDMLVATGMAATVANHAPELESLRGTAGVFFSRYPGAAGIVDEMRHHRFYIGTNGASRMTLAPDRSSRRHDLA